MCDTLATAFTCPLYSARDAFKAYFLPLRSVDGKANGTMVFDVAKMV
ncbi:hypothetical protein [Mycobacterium lehmannii]|nr:hypothetical protein [Mycobacterium lehmannii]